MAWSGEDMARRQSLDEVGFAHGPVEVGGSVHHSAKMRFAQQVALELTAQMDAKNQKDEAVFLMQKLSYFDYCEIRMDIGKQGGMEQPDQEAKTKKEAATKEEAETGADGDRGRVREALP